MEGAVFKLEVRRLFSRIELRFAFVAMLVLVAIAFIESCLRFAGSDVSALPSAAYGWPWNMDRMQIQSMRVLAFFLMFLIAASVFSDNFLLDIKEGITPVIASRCSLRSYLASNALLSFAGGFLIMLIPLVISQILAFLIFPINGTFANHFNNPVYMYEGDGNLLFPSLTYNFPYLNNMVYALYASLWAGGAALLSFSISLLIRKNRLICLGIPTAISLLSWQIAPVLAGGKDCMTHFFYLYPFPSVPGLSVQYFVIAPLVVLAASAVLIAVALRIKKDVLL